MKTNLHCVCKVWIVDIPWIKPAKYMLFEMIYSISLNRCSFSRGNTQIILHHKIDTPFKNLNVDYISQSIVFNFVFCTWWWYFFWIVRILHKKRYAIRTIIKSKPKIDATTSASFHNESFLHNEAFDGFLLKFFASTIQSKISFQTHLTITRRQLDKW